MPVTAGQGDSPDRAAPPALLQLNQGLLQPLLADPLARCAAQPLAEGVLQGAAGVVAPGLQVAQAQGLVEVGADVVDQLVKAAAPGPPMDAPAVGCGFLQQLGLRPAHHQPQQHIIQAQPCRQGGMAAEAGVQVLEQGMELAGLQDAEFGGPGSGRSTGLPMQWAPGCWCCRPSPPLPG